MIIGAPEAHGLHGSHGAALAAHGSQQTEGAIGMVTAWAGAPRRNHSHVWQPDAPTVRTPTAANKISFFIICISGRNASLSGEALGQATLHHAR